MPNAPPHLLTRDIRQRIREARTELGLTQERLASHLGVSRSTVKNWETGRVKNCRLHHWHHLMTFLNGGMRQKCFVTEQLGHLRNYLREHAPQPLRQSFLTALKKAERNTGGLEALLMALEIFLQKIGKEGL